MRPSLPLANLATACFDASSFSRAVAAFNPSAFAVKSCFMQESIRALISPLRLLRSLREGGSSSLSFSATSPGWTAFLTPCQPDTFMAGLFIRMKSAFSCCFFLAASADSVTDSAVLSMSSAESVASFSSRSSRSCLTLAPSSSASTTFPCSSFRSSTAFTSASFLFLSFSTRCSSSFCRCSLACSMRASFCSTAFANSSRTCCCRLPQPSMSLSSAAAASCLHSS
mmetsp:Transcript_35231/g.80668  ORF Transcript_35231/g.80668 Transcript_35231/m.80668 type:complete len:226 (+) Transcript_35231:860-1537(+)